MVFNLRSQNELNFTIPNELENLKYEEKAEFIRFLNESYAEFKSFSADSIKKEENKSEPINTTDTKVTEATTQKTKITKEEVNTNTGESKKEKIEVEVKEKEKIDLSSTDINTEEKDKKELIKPRNNNYMTWILGTGLTGLIGIGLLYMLSRKRY